MLQSCWIATDGAKGNEKQCLALAHYMGLNPEVFRVSLRFPWAQLAPAFRLWPHRAVKGALARRIAASQPTELPDVLISCGRRGALCAIAVSALSRGKTRTVHILNPRIASSHFDWVVCPRHDGIEAENVIVTTGALHRIDDEWLQSAKQEFGDLGSYPRPRIALLVGGSNSAYTLGVAQAERLSTAAKTFAKGGSVLVTTSGRTPGKVCELMKKSFRNIPGIVWTGNGPGKNPYSGILAWADRIIASPDSINMISEALGTGKPVHCPPLTRSVGRFHHFHRFLIDAGMILPLGDPSEHSLDQPLDGKAPYSPLRETQDVACRLIAAMDC